MSVFPNFSDQSSRLGRVTANPEIAYIPLIYAEWMKKRVRAISLFFMKRFPNSLMNLFLLFRFIPLTLIKLNLLIYNFGYFDFG